MTNIDDVLETSFAVMERVGEDALAGVHKTVLLSWDKANVPSCLLYLVDALNILGEDATVW